MSRETLSPNVGCQHIHILGASGSGTTTLGKRLSEALSYEYFDSDDYFWKIKYSEPYSSDVRLSNLKRELSNYNNWILSGSVIDWGNPLIPSFDLVIFMSATNEVRLKRLYEREYQRFGEAIFPGGEMYEEFLGFMEWTGRYETGGMELDGCWTRVQQRRWLDDLPCAVLEINGDNPVEANKRIVLDDLLG